MFHQEYWHSAWRPGQHSRWRLLSRRWGSPPPPAQQQETLFTLVVIRDPEPYVRNGAAPYHYTFIAPPALPIHLRPLLFNRVVLCTPVFASGSAVPSLHDVLQVSVHLEYPHEPSPCACVEAQALLAPTLCLPVAFTHKETRLIPDNFTARLCCSDATSSRKITP